MKNLMNIFPVPIYATPARNILNGGAFSSKTDFIKPIPPVRRNLQASAILGYVRTAPLAEPPPHPLYLIP